MTDAIVSDGAEVGKNVTIGPFTVIHDNVCIGADTTIESHCVIGRPATSTCDSPLVIGKQSHIRSHSVFYEGSTFGRHLVTGHAVLVRENCSGGRYLQIGSRSEIHGPTEIGNYVRLHSDVHISEGTEIGDFVWIFPRVQFANDPFPPSHIRESVKVGDMAVIATGTILLPGVRVGVGSFIGAGSVVRKDVPDAHCVTGDPAAVFATVDRFFNLKHGLSYPWPKHFMRGYPEDCADEMNSVVKRIEAALERHVSSGTKGERST